MTTHESSIAELRSRLSALVEQEGALLAQAFDLSRAGADRQGVDALFARVQSIQVERSSLKKRIGSILGTHRLHSAPEVWRPGVYDYRHEVGGPSMRVRVVSGPLGLQVVMPGKRDATRIETLHGTFDGPLAVDDDGSHQELAPDSKAARAQKPPTRRRQKKSAD